MAFLREKMIFRHGFWLQQMQGDLCISDGTLRGDESSFVEGRHWRLWCLHLKTNAWMGRAYRPISGTLAIWTQQLDGCSRISTTTRGFAGCIWLLASCWWRWCSMSSPWRFGRRASLQFIRFQYISQLVASSTARPSDGGWCPRFCWGACWDSHCGSCWQLLGARVESSVWWNELPKLHLVALIC